jgi:hypothetical protein
MGKGESAEQVVREIRRRTRRFSAEEKIGSVPDRGGNRVAGGS